MPKVGVEPTRANAHYALNVARLPVPPLRRDFFQREIIRQFMPFVKQFAPNQQGCSKVT